jgi:Type IV secretion system pilin
MEPWPSLAHQLISNYNMSTIQLLQATNNTTSPQVTVPTESCVNGVCSPNVQLDNPIFTTPVNIPTQNITNGTNPTGTMTTGGMQGIQNGSTVQGGGGAKLSPDDPCSLFNCLGSFKNNSRYQGGTAGQIASNIAVDIAVLMTYVAGSIAIIFVLVGAFKMLTSEGDTKKYEDGLKSIRYAITGLVFSVLAYGLIAVVLTVLGAWSN